MKLTYKLIIKWVLIAEIAVTKKYNSQQFNQTMTWAFAVKSAIQLPLGGGFPLIILPTHHHQIWNCTEM